MPYNFANYSNTLENYVTINSSNGPGYDKDFGYLYSNGYTSVTSLTYNAENLSVYHISTTGWELNNIVSGGNEHTNATGIKIYRRSISKRGFVSFTHYYNPQGFTSNSGRHLTLPKFPPSSEDAPALPDNIVTNSSLFQYNVKVLGITIDIPGVYEISVVRKVRDKYQTLQKNGFPSPLPYKNSIFICIFKQDTLNTDIINYFINNRRTLYSGAPFPYNTQFKYTPQSGNYCKTYLEQGDIVCVYTNKNLSEVIFSGNWLNEGGGSGSITNFSTTLYGFGNLTNQTYGFTNT